MMNRKEERTKLRHVTLRSMWLTALAAILLVGATRTAQAQWTSPDANGNTSTTGSGNVGVGTSTPTIAGTNARGIHITASGVAGLRLDTLAGGGHVYEFESINNGNLGLYDLTASSYRLYVLGNGNVGIGTTTPGTYYGVPAKLDVSGATFGVINANAATGYSSAITFSENGAAKWAITSRNTMDAPNNRLSFLNNSTAEVFTILSGGEVGVGTLQPNARLQVNITSAAAKGFIVKGAASQTGNMMEFQDSNGNVMSSLSPGGINTLSLGQNGYGGQILLGGSTISTAYSKIYFPGGVVVNGGIYDAYSNQMFNSSQAGVNFNATTNTTPSLTGFTFNATLAATSQKIASFMNAGVEKFVITYDGKVGVGTSSPQAALDVNGNINVSGNINAKYQDVAEWVSSRQRLSAGTVVILDPERTNQVIASTEPYDTRVAGVISERPGLILGEAGEDKVKVATTGRVRVKVDASKGAIRVGDLLVTSDREGVAMKSDPVNVGGIRMHRPGTIIGKALEPLESGTGEIMVLLSLQ